MDLKDFLEIWGNEKDRVLVHTSGSTGKPKEMWVEKNKMRNSARITCDFLGIQSGDCISLFAPRLYCRQNDDGEKHRERTSARLCRTLWSSTLQ